MNLLVAIRGILSRDWTVKILHVYHESNRVVDFLASEALKNGPEMWVLSHPPLELQQLLEKDRLGVDWPRRVPATD
ncbi:hypothetical protein PTKIN_Ptkin09bG0259600 [Pterospermum kingtungense]